MGNCKLPWLLTEHERVVDGHIGSSEAVSAQIVLLRQLRYQCPQTRLKTFA